MAEKQKIYQKLPGKTRNFFTGFHRVWQGRDHLLAVDNRGFSEDYKRFYYKDIQALVMRKTAWGKIVNAIFGLVLSGFFFGAYKFAESTPEAAWVMGGIAVLIVLLIAYNCWRGPTCTCHIKTAIQTEKLPSINRIKVFHKVMARVQPLIRDAQGTLDPQTMQSRIAATERFTMGRRGPVPAASAHADNPEDLPPVAGWAHLALFLTLIVSGALVVLSILDHRLILSVLGSFAYVAITFLLITALVKQSRGMIDKALKAVTWSTLGYLMVLFMFGYVINVMVAIKNPELANNHMAMVRKTLTIAPQENKVVYAANLFAAVCSFGLGISGMLLTLGHLRTRRACAAVTAGGLKPDERPIP